MATHYAAMSLPDPGLISTICEKPMQCSDISCQGFPLLDDELPMHASVRIVVNDPQENSRAPRIGHQKARDLPLRRLNPNHFLSEGVFQNRGWVKFLF